MDRNSQADKEEFTFLYKVLVEESWESVSGEQIQRKRTRKYFGKEKLFFNRMIRPESGSELVGEILRNQKSLYEEKQQKDAGRRCQGPGKQR